MTVTSLSGFGVQDAGQPWSLTAPDSSALRFELRAQDHWSSDYSTSVQRTEINDLQTIAPRTPIELTYNFTVEPGPTSTADWVTLGQMHSVSEGVPPHLFK